MQVKKIKQEKPRVLMIGAERTGMGGVATVVDNYFEVELDKKINLHYITTMVDGTKLKKLFVAAISYLQFCVKLKQCDIVHVHMSSQYSFTRKVYFMRKAYKAGKKIILHQHAADFDTYFKESSDAKKKLIKKTFDLADMLIVLSKEWADFFGKNICDPDKITILHNSVILPQYQKKDFSDHNVLCLGRLGKRKGTYDLLKVIPMVLREQPNTMFYIGGDGDVEQCKEIAKREGFTERVKFLGWVGPQEKEQYFKKCSTFILPSYQEGMPMAILEAMSYGLTTISTNAGGIPQIINHGVDGFRIEAGDIIAIKDTLLRVVPDYELKEKTGQAATANICNNFNLSKNINTLIKIYTTFSNA